MKKVNRKILGGAIVFVCVMSAIGAGAKLSKKAELAAVPAAIVGDEYEMPVIVLDAGHGGST